MFVLFYPADPVSHKASSDGRKGNTNTHSIDDKHTIYSFSFAVLNNKCCFMSLLDLHKHFHTVTLNKAVRGWRLCVCLCGKVGESGVVGGHKKAEQ